MDPLDDDAVPPSRLEAWRSPEAAHHYAVARFEDESRASRDGRLVARLWPAGPSAPTVLDLPCGTGRLWPALPASAFLVAADRSFAMLAESRRHTRASVQRLRADARALPFADSSFDVVVCCRLLHHLERDADLDCVVRELVRVSRGVVLASFFDRHSWLAWRKSRAIRAGSGRSHRIARSRAELAACFAAAGAPVDRFAHSARFWSQQTFLRARREPPPGQTPDQRA